MCGSVSFLILCTLLICLTVLFYVVYTAGYNHLDVVEHLLETGADVNARDKGGLIPLHNASSYGVGW